jgi:hypothetical protein
VAPRLAVAVAIAEFDEVADSVEKAPEKLFSVPKSLSTAVTWVFSVEMSFPWLVSVACCAFH